jgi:hypothetical protein
MRMMIYLFLTIRGLSFCPPAGSVRVYAAAKRDATQRIVITGMGVASCFGNDPDVFYSTYVAQ